MINVSPRDLTCNFLTDPPNKSFIAFHRKNEVWKFQFFISSWFALNSECCEDRKEVKNDFPSWCVFLLSRCCCQRFSMVSARAEMLRRSHVFIDIYCVNLVYQTFYDFFFFLSSGIRGENDEALVFFSLFGKHSILNKNKLISPSILCAR